jgi:hypothetical protein
MDILRLLLQHGADPNVSDNMGVTCLHEAMDEGSVDAIALLLQFKANPNARNLAGETPLCWVVQWRVPAEIVNCTHLLLNHGASVSFSDFVGVRPLLWAVQRLDPGQAAKLIFLMAEHGFEMTSPRRDGTTPLSDIDIDGFLYKDFWSYNNFDVRQNISFPFHWLELFRTLIEKEVDVPLTKS